MKKIIFFFLIFLYLNHATLLWEKHFDSAIQTMFQTNEKVLIGTENGELYSIDITSGAKEWKIDLNESIRKIRKKDDLIIVQTNKRIFFIKNRKIIVKILRDAIFGLEIKDGVYFTSDRGLEKYTCQGTLDWINTCGFKNKSFDSCSGIELSKNIIFNAENYTCFVDYNGGLINRKNSLIIWNSKPILINNEMIIPAFNKNIYIFSSKIIQYITNGSFAVEPKVFKKIVYLANDAGEVFSINPYSNKISLIKKYTQPIRELLVNSTIIGDVIILSEGNKVHILNLKGKTIFDISMENEVKSLGLFMNRLFIGTKNGNLAVYKLDRGCSFNQENIKIGYKPYILNGSVFSRYGGEKVYIQVNNQTWQKAKVINHTWQLTIDPNNYPEGLIIIKCKVRDVLGEEQNGFNYIVGQRDLNLPKMEMEINYSQPTKVNEEIMFNIKYNNHSLKDITIIYENKTILGYDGIKLKFSSSGKKTILFKKIGFYDKKIEIDVKDDNLLCIVLPIITLIIIGGAIYLYIKNKNKIS